MDLYMRVSVCYFLFIIFAYNTNLIPCSLLLVSLITQYLYVLHIYKDLSVFVPLLTSPATRALWFI